MYNSKKLKKSADFKIEVKVKNEQGIRRKIERLGNIKMNVKKLIVQTFIDIGNKEGFDNVTISKIVKACNISRTAFYYHFEDIPDMIDYYLQERISAIMSECAKMGDMKKGIGYSTENLVYNFNEYNKLMESKWRNVAEICMYKSWTSFAEKMFSVYQKEIPIRTTEKTFLIQFISGGICHYIVNGNHEEISADEFAEQLRLLLKTRIAGMKR